MIDDLDKEILKSSKDLIKEKSRLRGYISLGTILIDWIIISVCIYTSVKTQLNPFITAISIFVIGTRQHALFILMHEATHNRLSNNSKFNDFLGDFCCAFPLFFSNLGYRLNHLPHHMHVNSSKDPDWARKKGLKDWEFPKSKAEIGKVFLKYAVGFGFLEMLMFIKIIFFVAKLPTRHRVSQAVFYIPVLSGVVYFDAFLEVFALWIVPYAMVLLPINRFRIIAEHFGVEYNRELDHSRNVITNKIEEFIFAPHGANYHMLHHLFPSIPFYNLKALHDRLMNNKIYRKYGHHSAGYLMGGDSSVINEVKQNASKISPSMERVA